MIYLVLLFFLAVVGFLFSFSKQKEKGSKYFLVIFGCSLVFISTARHLSVGTDTANYAEILKFANGLSFQQAFQGTYGVDNGYLVYNKILLLLSSSPYFMMLINSLIITLGLVGFIHKNSKTPSEAVFVYITMYYFCVSLNIVRQFMVISLMLTAYECLKSKKYALFVMLSAFSIVIHKTAIIMVLASALFLFKPSYKKMLMFFVFGVLATMFIYTNPNILMGLSDNYDRYLDTEYFSSRQVGGTVIIWFAQLILFLYSLRIVYLNRDKIGTDERIEQIYTSSIMVILSVFISIIGTQISIVVRMSYYFDVYMIILLPLLINYIIKEKYIAKTVIYALLLLYFIYNLSSGGSGVVPYRFYWQ